MPSTSPDGARPLPGLLPAFINQALFSDHHLEHRIQEMALWQAWTPARCQEAHQALSASLEAFGRVRRAGNEEDTRQWLDEVLEILRAKFHREGRTQTGYPDYVLFPDQQARELASAAERRGHREAYYSKALTILEAKYWGRPLQGGAGTGDRENPVMQINRYLDDAAILTDNAVQWAVLTNGIKWRLYWRGASSRALTHYEVDLPELLADPHKEAGDFHRLRYFLAFFGPEAFVRDAQGRCNLDRIREASEQYAVEVGGSLERAIYAEEGAFLTLAKGLYLHATAGGDSLEDSPLKDLRALETNTLVLLFRLLFLLYAEDRHLLPLDRREYAEASLSALRDEVAGLVDRADIPTSRRVSLWGRLENLFDLVNDGDPGMGLPYYNGGLFNPERHPLLRALKVPDAQLIPALDALSRVGDPGERVRVDFRDLGVRQLGSLYEGLLEYRLHLDEEGNLFVSQDSLERRTTASYYTHETLVERLVADTLDPILREREQAAETALRQWLALKASTPASEGERLVQARDLMVQEKAVENLLLDLRIVDPAMGSGHFLVAVLDHLTDGLMAILAHHQEEPELALALEHHPVLHALAHQREAIGASLVEQGLGPDVVDGILPHLDDLRLLKRLVMKRCLFGVDLNPMAVELAKLSLWLDSFTLGAPLSFLDHHLKSGNSLVGATLEDYTQLRQTQQVSLLAEAVAFDPHEVLEEVGLLVGLADATREQVHQSQDHFKRMEEQLALHRTMLDVVASRDFSNKPRRTGSGRRAVVHDDAATLLEDEGALRRLSKMIQEGKENVGRLSEHVRLAALNVLEDRARHHFFHWDLAFPEVFLGDGERGFDAVITNPPWERIKLQENEFFGQHRPELAQLPTAARRRAAIQALRTEDPELWASYEAAKVARDELLVYAHESGKFPLLGRGDTNLYAIMVEKGLALLKPMGRGGFVVPSGISTDLGNAPFFGGMVQEQRLAFLYDFENRRGLFPNVHRSQKFSLIGFTGPRGGASRIPAAFFLHEVSEVGERRMELDPADFTLLNPNSKTCPVFRNPRDYALTKRIYLRVPVLRRHRPAEDPWGVTYKTLFHMTNDSGLFKTSAELEGMGSYREAGPMPVWNGPLGRFLPLMEGKMVQAFDPRAASVVVNFENLHRPAQAAPSTGAQWADPNFFPTPQSYVSQSEVEARATTLALAGMIGFKSVTSPTNARTMIAAWLPRVGVGNSMAVLLSSAPLPLQTCLLACMNSLVYDFVLRQKIGGQNLNFFYIEQQPTLPPNFYEERVGAYSWLELVHSRAFELSYNCEALSPLARGCGFDGKPFMWDQARRRHLRAQLDALFFLAYGFDKPIDEPEVDYILSTFPILAEQDPGYRGLVLGYHRAYRIGHFEAAVPG